VKPLSLYAPNLKRYETDYMDSRKGWKAVSVTGTSCAFNCKHCGRRILEGMSDGSTPQRLEEILRDAVRDGDRGVILSGGSTSRGEVPVWRFSQVVRKYSDRLTVIAHTGVVRSLEVAKKFAESGVNVGLLDMVGDDETIREVLGQPFTVEDYLNSFKFLKQAGLKVVPHVVVGLSKRGSEAEAVLMLKEVSPDALIVVAMMPLTGEYKLVREPSPQEIIQVLKLARDEYPGIPIVLGCARPRGNLYLPVEKFAVDYGVDGIAFPEEETVDYAKGRRELRFSSACCANVVHDFISSQVSVS